MTKPKVWFSLVFSAFLNCKKLRREVWTVRLPKFVVHTSKSINNSNVIYMKLVCAVIKLESLIMAQNVRWRHA